MSKNHLNPLIYILCFQATIRVVNSPDNIVGNGPFVPSDSYGSSLTPETSRNNPFKIDKVSNLSLIILFITCQQPILNSDFFSQKGYKLFDFFFLFF